MQRKCSICGSHMLYTPNGYKCSFCTHTEPLDSKPAGNDTPRPNTERKKAVPKKNSAKKTPLGIIIAVVLVAVLIFNVVPLIFLGYVQQKEFASYEEAEVNDDYESKISEFSVEESMPEAEMDVYDNEIHFESETMIRVVEKMFGKPIDEVTQEDLASIQYLDMEVDWLNSDFSSSAEWKADPTIIRYSMEDYREYALDFSGNIYKEDAYNEVYFSYGEDFVNTIQTISVQCNDEVYGAIYKDVRNFKNLRALKLDNYSDVNLADFPNLSMIECYDDINELLELNLPAGQIEVLKTGGNDLSGIENFTSLKKLYLEGNDMADLDKVAECKMLDTLYCMNLNGMSLESLSTLSNLKNLYVDGSSDGLKDLSVAASFRELENLVITDTEILNINFLGGMENLKTLRLSENSELRNFEGLSGLTNLSYLHLSLGGLNGDQPEYSVLGKLKSLKHLSLDTVYNLDFLYELPQLEELEVDFCFYDNLLDAITKMSHLNSLTLANCHAQYQDGFACLKELKELKKLTITSTEFQGAVDGLFALDNLEELRITSCKFYQAPSSVAVNENLKVLDLSYVEFITMPETGEYRFVGYEDETIAQNVLQNYFACTALEELYLDDYLISDLSGLNNLFNLKVLSLSRCNLTEMTESDLSGCPMLEEVDLSFNQVSNLSFVKNLPNLKSMNLEECYVTDLKPLAECEKLCYVNVKANPVSNNPLSDVEVIMD